MTILRKFKKEWANSSVRKVIILSILSMILMTFFQNYITIGINITESLPQKIFIMVKVKKEMIREKYYGFKYAGKSGHYYAPGTKFIKKLAGGPGDILKTDLSSRSITLITGRKNKIIYNLADRDSKGKKITEIFIFNGEIPEDKYFFVGESNNSYDSRYWGLVDEKDIIGRAYPFL